MQTVRLLSTYDGNPPNTIVTVDDAVAAQLLVGNIGATTDLSGGVYSAKTPASFVKTFSKAPKKRQQVSNSIMYIGDSISANGVGMAHLPRNVPVRYMSATTPNLNAGGAFVSSFMTSATCPTGNGTLRFYAADSTMTWQAFGDTEGPRVTISMDACFYKIDSGTGGREAYLALIPRWKPTSDKADTFNVSGSIKLRNNCASTGVVGWTNTLLGNPYDDIYPFCISSIKASDWWAARAQWQDIYTNDTHIFVGTNDVTSYETAMQALVDVENIAQSRLDIGSTVVLGSLLPYDDRTTAATQAAVEFNSGLRTLAARLGVDLWDTWRFVGLSTGTGGYAPGMSADKLHPTAKGAYLIAKRGPVALLSSRVKKIVSKPFAGAAFNATTAPYGNVLVNPQLTGTVAAANAGMTGEIPTSWTLIRESGSTITAVSKAPASASPVPLPDNIPGAYWSVAISNANASAVNGEGIRMRPSALISAGFSAGDYFVFEGEIRISGTGIQTFSVVHTLQGGSAPTSAAIDTVSGPTVAVDNLDGDTVRIPFRSAPILVEAANTSMSVGFIVIMNAGGTATFELSPVGLSLHRVPAP